MDKVDTTAWSDAAGPPRVADRPGGVPGGVLGSVPGSGSVRLHRVLLCASVLLPALLFALAAWQNHGDVLRENASMLTRTAAVMQEHGRKVMETAELALGEIDQRIEGQRWAQIADPGTSEFLRRLKAPLDQFVSLWVADADGVMRAGSQPWPPGSGIGTRSFFQAQQREDRGVQVGSLFSGMATATRSFAIIQRRTTAGGRFDGTIHAAASPAYFAGYYAQAAPPIAHAAMLVRADGTILARDPPFPGQDMADPGLLANLVAGSTAGRMAVGANVPIRGHYAARKVGRWPLYVVFAVPHAVMLERWHRNMQVYGGVAGAVGLTLLLMSWLALRRAKSEQAALARLQAESTQRLAAEQQLRHAQRMEAVGQLTGGVAHDFNNLLTAILGNLEMIDRAATTGRGVEKIPRLAGTAIKAVQRGASLTRSLLAFSRKQQMRPRAIDANALLLDFLDLVRQAVGTGIAVVFEAAHDLELCIADPVELEAAVLNLAINARDAMAGTGTLRLRTGLHTLAPHMLAGNPEAQPGAFVFIEVSDTGPGMTPEVADKAFEPFFTTKPIGKGTGLGLSQVFGFVRQLGGHVTIACPPGHGAVITVSLPVAPAAEP